MSTKFNNLASYQQGLIKESVEVLRSTLILKDATQQPIERYLSNFNKSREARKYRLQKGEHELFKPADILIGLASLVPSTKLSLVDIFNSSSPSETRNTTVGIANFQMQPETHIFTPPTQKDPIYKDITDFKIYSEVNGSIFDENVLTRPFTLGMELKNTLLFPQRIGELLDYELVKIRYDWRERNPISMWHQEGIFLNFQEQTREEIYRSLTNFLKKNLKPVVDNTLAGVRAGKIIVVNPIIKDLEEI